MSQSMFSFLRRFRMPSADLLDTENCCLTAGVWYYPPVAGSGGFMLNNPPFSPRGDNFEFEDDGDNA